MTLEEIRLEIWKALGEPTDLDPSTDTSYNGGPYLTFVANMAQRRIASYKTVKGRIIRLPNLVGDLFFKSKVIKGSLEIGGSTSTVELPVGDVGTQDDRYNGWIFEVNGETRLIVDYDGASRTATLSEDLSSAPEMGDEYSLYKSFSLLVPSSHAWASEHIILPEVSDRWRADGNLIEVLKIEDLANERTLGHAARGASFVTLRTSTGDPTEWYRFGNKIYFNYAPEEEQWFRMEYYRTPTDMSAPTDEPEIPEQFHYGVILWGIEWGYRREGESNEKYSTKRDFQGFMERTVENLDIAGERSFGQGKLKLK